VGYSILAFVGDWEWENPVLHIIVLPLCPTIKFSIMTDFLPEPRDRLDGPICKSIESKDFKQALKLVDKRLAKNSTDPYLLVCLQ
jgi:hypothetical protein